MTTQELNFAIDQLGGRSIRSPMRAARFVTDADRILYHASLDEIQPYWERGEEPPQITMAGPRQHLHFDPAATKAGIVTCGGLCPGLNDVIRALTLSLHFHYGVKNVYGFRYGYQGLNPAYGHRPLTLTPELVDNIGQLGGTILGSSRGPQDVGVMVDTLVRKGVNILFTIGGDGTLRGARAIATEIARRKLDISVIGVPKTIDNDIAYIQQTFGFQTAAQEAHTAVESAHAEATGAPNGVGLVKLMGRESGFIAAYTTLVDSMVSFCLVPEAPFTLEAFLPALRDRLQDRHHAVIAVAEGAGQDLFPPSATRDKSGNVKLGDIGVLLRNKIKEYFAAIGMDVSLKYIDPSYTIRSIPANAFDSAFCLMLGHNAVHAAMAGYTNAVVGYWKDAFTLTPISMAVSKRKQIDPDGWLWSSVLASTGQPRDLT
jgi:6-phosphofructokinase 1